MLAEVALVPFDETLNGPAGKKEKALVGNVLAPETSCVFAHFSFDRGMEVRFLTSNDLFRTEGVPGILGFPLPSATGVVTESLFSPTVNFRSRLWLSSAPASKALFCVW